MTLPRRETARMARLGASAASFGASLLTGLGLGHAPRTGIVRYNGSGLAGDARALRGDFRRAVDRATHPAAGTRER